MSKVKEGRPAVIEHARFVALRLIKSIAVLFSIAMLSFVLIKAAPGDPAAILAGDAGIVDAEFVERTRHEFGLDRPLVEQVLIYAGRVLRLDFGDSYRQQRPVFELIVERLPATVLLTLSAFAIALVVGIGLGILAARHVGRWPDTLIAIAALLFFAMPMFWTGLMAVLLFSLRLGWLPAFGISTVGGGYTGLPAALDVARHLVLPAVTLGLFYVAPYLRMTRAAIIEVMDLDFVRTARARGLGEGRVWRRHILRNALLPIITLASLQAGHLVGGAVLTETVFAWPGIGRLAFDALAQRDYNLLLAIFFFSSALVVVFNFLADILYGLADPRIEAAR